MPDCWWHRQPTGSPVGGDRKMLAGGVQEWKMCLCRVKDWFIYRGAVGEVGWIQWDQDRLTSQLLERSLLCPPQTFNTLRYEFSTILLSSPLFTCETRLLWHNSWLYFTLEILWNIKKYVRSWRGWFRNSFSSWAPPILFHLCWGCFADFLKSWLWDSIFPLMWTNISKVSF